LAVSDDRLALIERLKTDPDWVQSELRRMEQVNTERIWTKVENRLKPTPSIPLSTLNKRRRWYYAAAASFIIVASATSLYWFKFRHAYSIATTNFHPVAPSTDIKPGGNKAILTLADGRKIDLGTTANGLVADQGSTKVAKLSDGQLVYKKTVGEKPPSIAYNSLSTPKAGQFELLLPDGTRVWLNNASTIRYPVAFTGPDRTVELAGEAYFEVAKDAAHPFRVKVQTGATVDVLGTSFNIMAYSDEPTERTTLIDGSIRITENNQSALLKPAEQTALDPHGTLNVIPNVNVQEVIAWKNGYFHFDHASLQTTMRQLARWYDIDVVYQGQIPDHEYQGRIQRDLLLSDVLKNLESDQIHFKLEGRKLIVTQ
jgi:ferric-dicitrate binding protein FerR (iron transport regulator)